MKPRVTLLLLFLLAVACAPQGPTPSPTSTPIPAPETTAPEQVEPTEPSSGQPQQATATQPAVEPTGDVQEPSPTESAPTDLPVIAQHPGGPLPTDRDDLFAGSGACGICHTNLNDEGGADVSIDTYWRSTMMANAARDPYWLATVRTEVLRNPAYREIIEAKCATCHTPMAHTSTTSTGGTSRLLDDGFLDPVNPDHSLAIDGVSCTLCHQIEQQPMGQYTTFSGNYPIDTERPAGERITYGPLPVSPEGADLMLASSGYEPVESKHLHQAMFCATCHTLYTPYLDSNDEVAGEFPEQTPFLEWRHSAYHGQTPCVGCHMPQAEGGVVLSLTGGEPKQPFSQHSFVGGNAFVLRILQSFPEEHIVTASTEHFEATIARVTQQIENRTAVLTLENLAYDGATLQADVEISILTGHKFPTGFPSRRAWLHLTIADGSGQTLFESGAVGPDGSIVGNDNDADPGSFEPHYTVITRQDQVQIYEAIMEDTEGQVTTTLLRGAGYTKDNRLLPTGFDATTSPTDIAVYGEAALDEDFTGGSDRVRLEVPVSNASGELSVRVELLYQSVGFRWAQGLGEWSAADEVDAFLGYYQALGNQPLTVASIAGEVEP